MKHIFTILIAVLSFSAYTQTNSVQHSKALVETSPATVGMSEERLARIDVMLNSALEYKQVPGAVALIARNGKKENSCWMIPFPNTFRNLVKLSCLNPSMKKTQVSPQLQLIIRSPSVI